MFRRTSSASTDNLPFAVGDRVRIRDSSASKGAGSEGIVVSISAKMTRLNTGFSTKHKHIELVQTPPEPKVKKKTETKFKSEKPNIAVPVCTNEDLLREIQLNRIETSKLKEEIVDMKADFEAKLQSLFEIMEINQITQNKA